MRYDSRADFEIEERKARSRKSYRYRRIKKFVDHNMSTRGFVRVRDIERLNQEIKDEQFNTQKKNKQYYD